MPAIRRVHLRRVRRRRIQRSVRATVAAVLLGAASLFVGISVATSSLVRVAAVLSLLLGVLAARIIFSEVVQTRRQASRDRAAQAREFLESVARSHAEHLTFGEMMTGRVSERDQRIGALTGFVRLAELRADDAESRVRREARRANEAQERLAAVLDEVFGTAGYDVAAEEPSTVVHLLDWDEKTKAAARADAALAAELAITTPDRRRA